MIQLQFNFPIAPNSLVTTNQAKSDILEYTFNYAKRQGEPFKSVAHMIHWVYGVTEAEYFAKPFTENDRRFYYLIKSSYANNVKL